MEELVASGVGVEGCTGLGVGWASLPSVGDGDGQDQDVDSGSGVGAGSGEGGEGEGAPPGGRGHEEGVRLPPSGEY